MWYRLISIVFAANLLFSTPSFAALISHGSYATDSISGMDWLHTSFTLDKSYDDVLADPGYDWFGDGSAWRVATVTEALDMFESAFGAPLVLDVLSAQNDGLEKALERAIGRTYEVEEYLPPDLTVLVNHIDFVRLVTSTVDPANPANTFLVAVSDFTHAGLPIHLTQEYVNSGASFPTSAGPSVKGIAIVRDSAQTIPIPGTAWLVSLGLAGILCGRKPKAA